MNSSLRGVTQLPKLNFGNLLAKSRNSPSRLSAILQQSKSARSLCKPQRIYLAKFSVVSACCSAFWPGLLSRSFARRGLNTPGLSAHCLQIQSKPDLDLRPKFPWQLMSTYGSPAYPITGCPEWSPSGFNLTDFQYVLFNSKSV